ncbi:2-succinyl-5-enolpyruvyl-6-hydroxy-3-cyclohexene-1-carboxylic-acid synthase [Prevotella sp. KH2C16]|uniref:2-succinyl-5-enolpyruvyl-6-hydroxy-3- cyclohexene-1-carboxylic-acid synthase n=1 Tax=Prevotella sp. KH2C16 TaxID=1855325 RepID=UPI0008EC8765|nr:2-succinyl-5-enolpyruvyl-6-hydroxy-3-cyclohexene-1-carboxylic-acid synthase [Prevotella sp. KH2C16]SFG25046.1 2-succinyl-5-enolpyruvyl-6-hydroxy-3-cyclohexene-1-carboxylate synthase [Prevotella sp. KH2C16]
MYSDKENVNILTALLVGHGVRHAVVCPGSRNSAIVHNLNECPAINCHPVTDERSAAFCALGMCQATGEPVVVCVTSGTALLNVLPAVAEACYQHQPLVVVSADRPAQWIDQLDGQTLPQPGTLGRFVRKAVSLPEPRDGEERWYCNRLVNEALMACRREDGGPVHINVPLSEPLFDYTVESLPRERVISLYAPKAAPVDEAVIRDFEHAERSMVVVGQMAESPVLDAALEQLSAAGYAVLREPLSGNGRTARCLDEAVALVEDDDRYLPDCILYVGDTLVSKRARKYLRKARHARCWEVSPGGEPHDVLMNLTGVIQARPEDVLTQLRERSSHAFRDLWEAARTMGEEHQSRFEPPYSQFLAVKRLEEMSTEDDPRAVFHYANSTAVRLGCLYARHYIHCNRGVNGIEGSLSTAAGYSLVNDGRVYCVIGDLSFFYDQNALWNRNLRGNLRILLLNNGGGGIFYQLDGLQASGACDDLVAGRHRTTAEGICAGNDITYYPAHDATTLEVGLGALTRGHSDRPVVLEVFTRAEQDAALYRKYYELLKGKI